jgi:hypothetical protein
VITGLTITPPTLSVTGGAKRVRIRFKLSQAADVSICVLNSQGAVVRELDRPDRPAGWSSSSYFGHDVDGALLPVGRYPIIIVASNADGSATARTALTITSR